MPGDDREEVYKAHAAGCMEIARETDDREGKIALLNIARAWLALADQRHKNSHTTLLGSTKRHRTPDKPPGSLSSAYPKRWNLMPSSEV